MQTIVEPKQHIDKLWGKQRVKEEKFFRLMKYVLRVDHDGKVLLHNVVTGRLVVLDQDETEMLEQLPAAYSPVMEQLVTEHYLVPEDYDEHQQVVNLRNILWKIVDAHSPKEVTSYLILPTTACNARCWYCFEKDIKPITMSKETANDVADFIEIHCGGKPVHIWWFGGEPTIAANRIDQICERLKKKKINYFSDITTNGYLFDKTMIDKAKYLWNLRQVSISLDGTEENYNRIKAFPNAKENPYQRVMRNVAGLLEKGILVALRMNYDQDTFQDFDLLLKEVKDRFSECPGLMVYPHQINREYSQEENEAVETWFNKKNTELYDKACNSALFHRKKQELPSLSYNMCGAANGRWFVITPKGELACCGEKLDSSQIKGDIKRGVTNEALLKEWRQFADYKKCQSCILFPYCARIVNCNIQDHCYHKNDCMLQINNEMIATLDCVNA